MPLLEGVAGLGLGPPPRAWLGLQLPIDFNHYSDVQKA